MLRALRGGGCVLHVLESRIGVGVRTLEHLVIGASWGGESEGEQEGGGLQPRA